MVSERSLYLHYLRFLSALIVCLGHIKEFLFVHMENTATISEKFSRLFLGLGPSAVLVFFFLSGFLVGGKQIVYLFENALNLSNYLFDRLTRLWIVLFPAIFLTYILNLLTCRNSRVSLYCSADLELASHTTMAPLSSQNFSDLISNVFFLQPFRGTQWGGNGPLWSLSYEFWYYLIFFSIINIFGGLFKLKKKILIISHLVFILATSRFLDLKWWSLGIIWLSGAITAFLLRQDKIRDYARKIQKIFPFKFTIMSLVLVFPALVFLKILHPVISFPVAIIILTLSVTLTSDESETYMKKNSQKLIVAGAQFSFSLYLIHFPLIAFATSFVTPVDRWKMSPAGLLVLIGVAFGTLLVSYGFARLTEYKLTKLRLALKTFARA